MELNIINEIGGFVHFHLRAFPKRKSLSALHDHIEFLHDHLPSIWSLDLVSPAKEPRGPCYWSLAFPGIRAVPERPSPPASDGGESWSGQFCFRDNPGLFHLMSCLSPGIRRSLHVLFKPLLLCLLGGSSNGSFSRFVIRPLTASSSVTCRISGVGSCSLLNWRWPDGWSSLVFWNLEVLGNRQHLLRRLGY